MKDLSNVVIYNDGELELKVSLNEDTIWLTQKQISEVFGINIPAISKHIKNIYNDDELNQFSTVSILEIVQKEGNREVLRNVEHYNLDIILAVGYRTNSVKAIKFRQWATSVLKRYIQNGYAINGEKITNERFVSLESDVNLLKNKIENIENKIKDKSLNVKQGIFYDGQVFDAYSFVSDLLRSAKDEVVVIDNYIDDTTLTLFSKYPNLKIIIYTNILSKQLKLDFEKYSKQYDNVTLKTYKNSHDRFVILDKKEVYHIGASLKDLGKKWFAFSKMRLDVEDLMRRLV